MERRSFLAITTAVTGTMVVGLGLGNIVLATDPAADRLAAFTPVLVDLAAIPVGGSTTARLISGPVTVRHRSPSEIAKAESVILHSLLDPLTIRRGRVFETSADDVHRRATPDGRFIAVESSCPKGDCVTVDGGDFDAWFCPCCGSHFDSSGRWRKGIAGKNMIIPRIIVVNDAILGLMPPNGPTPVHPSDLDRLIYG